MAVIIPILFKKCQGYCDELPPAIHMYVHLLILTRGPESNQMRSVFVDCKKWGMPFIYTGSWYGKWNHVDYITSQA